MKTTSPARWPKNLRHRGSASSTSCASTDAGPRSEQLARPQPAQDPPDRHRDDEAEREAAEHHDPERVAPPVGHEGRRDDDRVHDRRGEHERDRRRRARAPWPPGAAPPAPSRTRRRGTPRPPPRRPAAAAPAAASAMRANAEAGTSTSIAADTVAPSRMNGIASTRSEPKTMSRLRSHGRLDGSARRTSTATPASIASTHASGGPVRSRRARPAAVRARGSTSSGHQQYLEKATANDG